MRFRKCCFPINSRGCGEGRKKKKERKGAARLSQYSISIDELKRSIARSYRCYLKKFNWRGEEKSVESFDTWRGSIACFGKYFALDRWPGTTPHAPFQRFLPALPRYLARGNDESSDFRRVEYFCSAIRSALALSCVGVTLGAAIRGRESRKYAPRKKIILVSNFPFSPRFSGGIISRARYREEFLLQRYRYWSGCKVGDGIVGRSIENRGEGPVKLSSPIMNAIERK